MIRLILNSNKKGGNHLILRYVHNRNNRLRLNEVVQVGRKRFLSQSKVLFNSPESLKPSSKIEKTVNELKDAQKNVANVVLSQTSSTEVTSKSQAVWNKVKAECKHYYSGFRLFFIETKVSCGLLYRLMRGHTLNRREHNLLTKTLADMFRLIPFSVFIIVPFMELLLPVFIKIFPNMLPSTFQKARDREEKLKQSLKLKLEMAKILTKTLDEMVVESSSHYSARAKEFTEWFRKVKTKRHIPEQELMRYVKVFEDEITLDTLDRSQLIALCRVLDISPVGNNYVLRQYLRWKIRHLRADDRIIVKEGIEHLNLYELQQACKARGLIVYGQTKENLRAELQRWLNLSLNEKVPASLLLLSRSIVIQRGSEAPSDTNEQLADAISSLSMAFAEQTKLSIGEKEGKVDNETLLNFIKDEEQKIKEERKEIKEDQDKAKVLVAHNENEVLKDPAPLIDPHKEIQSDNIEAIGDALNQISTKKKMLVEKEEIKELKEELADYADDVTDLKEAVQETPKVDVKESKAAKRLYTKVQTLIGKMDTVLDELDTGDQPSKKEASDSSRDEMIVGSKSEDAASKDKDSELIRIEEILNQIKKLHNVVDADRLVQINQFLKKLDDDRDGAVEVEDVLKIIEEIRKENVNIDSKQFDELIEMLNKEEIVEDDEEKTKEDTAAENSDGHVKEAKQAKS